MLQITPPKHWHKLICGPTNSPNPTLVQATNPQNPVLVQEHVAANHIAPNPTVVQATDTLNPTVVQAHVAANHTAQTLAQIVPPGYRLTESEARSGYPHTKSDAC